MTSADTRTRSGEARRQRSRALLHAAAIELAQQHPASSITGAMLAAAAGVHRSTVYEHGSDPASILRDALRAQLDEIRERWVAPATAETIIRATSDSTAELFAHVDQHAAIYSRELRADSAGLSAMLVEHIAQSVTLLIEHGALTPPAFDDDPRAVTRTVATVIGASAVAVIAVWTQQPEPRDRAALGRRWRAMLPPWWPIEA